MQHHFRARLRSGDPLIGTVLTLPSASVAEILADAGFDWLFIDQEHGAIDYRDVMAILQAVGHRIPCVVRVSKLDESCIKKVLDLGASGIIVPQINDACQAAKVVRYARYSPDGQRGIGLSRAQGYGSRLQAYLESANEQIALIVQAEHRQAAENIDEIAAVPGIDAVFVGPYDLSASLGKTGMLDDPLVTSAIDRITTNCREKNRALGIFAATSSAAQPHLQNGYRLIAVGTDTLFLSQSASGERKQLQDQQTGKRGFI